MTPDQFTRAQLRAQLRQRGYSEPQIIGAVDAAMAHTRVTDFGARVLIACRHAGRPLGCHQPFTSTTRPPAPQAFDATHPTGYSSTMLVWALDPLWRRCQRLALSDTQALADWLAAITPANLLFLSQLLPFADDAPQGRPTWQAGVIARPFIAQALANRVTQP